MKITLEINKGRIADLLCSGFESGINYWGCGNNIQGMGSNSDAPTIIWQELDGWNDAPVKECLVYPHCHYPLFDGGKYRVMDLEDNKKLYILDLPKIKSGLKIMAEKYPRHFGNWLSEDDDATTGDVFIQCCLFGEVKYG